MDALAQQLTYLQAEFDACQIRPKLHQHQITVYSLLIEIANKASSMEEYLQHTENNPDLDIPRAQQLDRYANIQAVYHGLGDSVRAKITNAMFAAVQQATDAPSMVQKTHAAKQLTATEALAQEQTLQLVPALASALLAWRTEPDSQEKQTKQTEIIHLWHILAKRYPQTTWTQLCQQTPYRFRLPFCKPQLQILETWLQEAIENTSLS